MDSNEKQIERPEFIRLKENFWVFDKGELLRKYEGSKDYSTAFGFKKGSIPFDFIDRIPDLFESVGEKQIEIKMVISCKDFISVDRVNDWFVQSVELQGWTCGGSVKELN